MNENCTQPLSGVITEVEAASILRVKPFTMRKWRREGGGPAYIRCGGRLIRYIKADIERWLNDNKFGNSAHEMGEKMPG